MKNAIKYLPAIIIAVLLAACSGRREIDALLADADALVDLQPDCALALLERANKDIMSCPRSQRMRYELLRTKAQYKTYYKFTSNSTMREVVDYYDQHGSAGERLLSHYLMGCIYRSMGETPHAIESFLTAISHDDTLTLQTDYSVLCLAYSNLADLYHKQFLLVQEAECRVKSMEYSLAAKDTANYIYSKCMLACTNMLQNQWDMAEELFVECKNFCETHSKEKEWIMYSYGLMQLYAETGKCQQDLKAIIDAYEAEYQDSRTKLLPSSMRQIYYYKGMYYENANRIDSAEICYRKIQREGNMSYKAKEPMYKGLFRIYQKKHMPDSMAKYASLYCEANDSSVSINDKEVTNRMAASYKYDRFLHEAAQQSQKAAEAQIRVMLVSVSAAVALVVSIFIIFYLRKRKQEKQLELERLAEGYRQTKDMLEQKQDYLIQLERNHQQAVELIRQKLDMSKSETQSQQKLHAEALQEIEDLNRSHENAIYSYKEEIECLRKKVETLSHYQGEVLVRLSERSDFLTEPIIAKACSIRNNPFGKLEEDDWTQLTDVFTLHFPLLIRDLQSHPELGEQSVKICLLVALKIQTKTIANILNVSAQRISNVKMELNRSLFDADDAKSLYGNLVDKYEIYTTNIP